MSEIKYLGFALTAIRLSFNAAPQISACGEFHHDITRTVRVKNVHQYKDVGVVNSAYDFNFVVEQVQVKSRQDVLVDVLHSEQLTRIKSLTMMQIKSRSSCAVAGDGNPPKEY